MSDTVYIIEDGETTHLVAAKNKSQAIAHVKREIKAVPAKPLDVARLLGEGVKLETAGDSGE
jgi:hypothetical protein